mgnify:CR=1 FL=1
MKEQAEKQVTHSFYAGAAIQELLSLAIAGDKLAASEIIRRQDEQKAEIESLKAKASKTRAPRAEKTVKELAADNAYFRTTLLVKQFGQESVNMQVLTAASAFLGCGLAQGNLRQALNRVQQVIRAQAIEETVFPEWVITAAEEIPTLDENKKLEEEEDKVAEIKAVIQKYLDNEQTSATAATEQPENSEQTPTPAVNAPAKKGGKK